MFNVTKAHFIPLTLLVTLIYFEKDLHAQWVDKTTFFSSDENEILILRLTWNVVLSTKLEVHCKIRFYDDSDDVM